MNKQGPFFIKEGTEYYDKSLQELEFINELSQIEGFFKKKRVAFVGIYVTKNEQVVYCCPKYMSDKRIEDASLHKNENSYVKKHMNLICKTIEKIRRESKNLDDTNYEFSGHDYQMINMKVNRYELAKFILLDYMENDVFVQNETVIKKNGKGKINWSSTIKKIKPIIDSDVIYTESLKKTVNTKNSDFLTDLHINIIWQCFECLNKIGEYEGIELPEKRMDLGINLKPYSGYIKQKMPALYSNRDIMLFKAMLSWCDVSPYYKNFGGTTSFDRVWEWTIDSVFGNIKNKDSAHPVYHLNENMFEATGEAKPDTINIYKSKDNLTIRIAILDAKYYCPKTIRFPEKNGIGQVSGMPANSDVVKQIGYYNAIKETCGKDNIDYLNAFLLPEYQLPDFQIEVDEDNDNNGDNQLFSCKGYVERGHFSALLNELKERFSGIEFGCNMKIDPVYIFSVSPDCLYDKYLNNSKLNDKELENLWREK